MVIMMVMIPNFFCFLRESASLGGAEREREREREKERARARERENCK